MRILSYTIIKTCKKKKKVEHKPSSFPGGISDIDPEESFLQRDRLALLGPWPGRFLWRTMNPPIPEGISQSFISKRSMNILQIPYKYMILVWLLLLSTYRANILETRLSIATTVKWQSYRLEHVLHKCTLVHASKKLSLSIRCLTRPIRFPLSLLATVHPLWVILHGLSLKARVRLHFTIEELCLCKRDKPLLMNRTADKRTPTAPPHLMLFY